MAVPFTPARPMPGIYMQTPAPARPAQPQFGRAASSSSLKPIQSQDQSRLGQSAQQPQAPSSENAAPEQQGSQASATRAITTGSIQPQMTPIERAAQTINNMLEREARYPDAEQYIPQGLRSFEYDISNSPAWSPFQKLRTYDIPDRIFEQYNQAQVSTMMGLFSELNHAWITIDNALYLWDYTHPNPDLVGYEDQTNTITAVKLVVPRKGVFKNTISHLLVVATTAEIILLGVSCERGPEGVHSISLYQTKLQVSVRGQQVDFIEGSGKTGRIFFAGKGSDDVFELTYQQEEKWFASRCGKINHVSKSFANVLPSLPFSAKPQKEYVNQLVIDDSRALLYTLSNTSTIRVFHMKPNNTLDLSITFPLRRTKDGLQYMNVGQQLLQDNVLASIHAISSTESVALNLMATTSTGYRIFFSAMSGYSSASIDMAPNSMQVRHVRAPPSQISSPSAANAATTNYPGQQPSSQITTTAGSLPSSDQLVTTRFSYRLPPGFFLAFVQKADLRGFDTLFISAPDPGRISLGFEQTYRYIENAMYIPLGSQTEDVGVTTPPFGASSRPLGFGNELAVQFDKTTTEIAILTNTGVHTIRRRRLVDIFASLIRYSTSSERGLSGDLKRFAQLYGRDEMSATALAVACGQGSDLTADMRVARVTDQDVLDTARKAFIEYGGKATLNENVSDLTGPGIDNVVPSPRHQGTALYISRLIRSMWNSPILQEQDTPLGLAVKPTVPRAKMQGVQNDLVTLKNFLNDNRSFIDGLAGPEALGKVTTKQEELALQGEHRALNSLLQLLSNLIEGIAFVQVLFDERADEILLSLSQPIRQQVRELTFQSLFCSSTGKELAKELVKAIVNRNIAKGSNIDTVADSLRRRCGSFCSADDVVIFKAQEQLKKASEQLPNSEISRSLLNESLFLFERVAASLTMEHLQHAVQQYVQLAFYAGAIKLALQAAEQRDRSKKALGWIRDGCAAQDPRRSAFDQRKSCYDLIHYVIQSMDQAKDANPEIIDGQLSVFGRRRNEAYEEINLSDDEVFQNDLFDWYLSQGWSTRLLELSSPYVASYLKRKSEENIEHADLLWKFHAQQQNYYEAASVQLSLAKSHFDLDLRQRVEYLSRAKANASTRLPGLSDLRTSRQSRQELLREASDLLDIAEVQSDVIDKVRTDSRIPEDLKQETLARLDGQILSVTTIFNEFADAGGYWEICLYIYRIADYRVEADICQTWERYIASTMDELARQQGEGIATTSPYALLSIDIETIGRKLAVSEYVFPVRFLLPRLLLLHITSAIAGGNLGADLDNPWVLDIFTNLEIPYETIVSILESKLWSDEREWAPTERKKVVAWNIVTAAQRWYEDTSRGDQPVFGGLENMVGLAECLRECLARRPALLENEWLEKARTVRDRVEGEIRRAELEGGL